MKKRYLLLIVVAVLLLIYLYPRVLEMRGIVPKQEGGVPGESQPSQGEQQGGSQDSTNNETNNSTGEVAKTVVPKASPLPKAERETAIIDFMTKYPGRWEVIKNEDGTINAIHGGNIPELGRSPQEIAGFLQQLAPLMGVESDQIQNTRHHQETNLMNTYTSDQVVDGIVVFNGVVRVSVKKEDGSIIAVDSMLREVGPYDKKAALARDEAFVIVMKKYGESKTRVLKGDDRPVLYAHEPDKTQLAWRFEVEVLATPHKKVYEVLVGFQSRAVIYESPMLVN